MNSQARSLVDSLVVEIGGVPVVLSCDNPDFLCMVQEQYVHFAHVVDPAADSSALRFNVHILDDGLPADDADVCVWKDGERWSASRGDFRVHLDGRHHLGSIHMQLNPYGLNSVLRIVHTMHLACRGGFLLHAASAVRNGAAFVFSGLSGAGKTTISRCAPRDVMLLSDEISYIRGDESGFRAFGTPFAGELARLGENISSPISTLFFLERGTRNRTLELDRAEAMRRLLRNILFFSADAELVQQVFDSAWQLLESVPAYRLAFVPDETVWDLVQ